jgi:hypothetical protein
MLRMDGGSIDWGGSLCPLTWCARPLRTVRQRTSAPPGIWNGRRKFKGVWGEGGRELPLNRSAYRAVRRMSAVGGKADMSNACPNVCF